MRIDIQKAYGLSGYELSRLAGQLNFFRADSRGRIYQNATKKAVLRALADRYPHVWPSVQQIAQDAGHGVTQTRIALRELESVDQLIIRIGKVRGGRRGTTAQYFVDERKIMDIVAMQQMFGSLDLEAEPESYVVPKVSDFAKDYAKSVRRTVAHGGGASPDGGAPSSHGNGGKSRTVAHPNGSSIEKGDEPLANLLYEPVNQPIKEPVIQSISPADREKEVARLSEVYGEEVSAEGQNFVAFKAGPSQKAALTALINDYGLRAVTAAVEYFARDAQHQHPALICPASVFLSQAKFYLEQYRHDVEDAERAQEAV